MDEVEQEAVEQLKKLLNDFDNEDISETDLWVINNLIEKQQKEINQLKKKSKDQFLNYEKVINEMEYNNLNYISKDKIRELKQTIHNTLDENGITRGYQQLIDKYFDELLEEN